ncbi:tRNA lysidine(34) synthetase TilS [uncultured Microbulbifer sp.]|uniref:tRNA lysidine(34) synthetase TilS n=1 Tax=uncultured Microbulbifer sp. TaxID=348147 RepID=UPI00260ED3E3|nr:tRNA lysidine(34) synthetase TilS [uncultured Microbulbifer sp.]
MISKSATHLLRERIKSALQRHPTQGQLWVGFSGGLDSTVLLHLLALSGIPVRVVHVHHGLSNNADRWLCHCEAFARELQVPFMAVRVLVDRGDGGVEQGARRARYKAFDSVMSSGDQILLGHHGDDQAETFLQRLMRGAGVLGLAGMSESRDLGEGKSLLRPLLSAGRSDLEAWAVAHGLSWIEDESNTDESLERNYLRRRVMPLLSARWPARQSIQRAADNLREASQLLEELALADLQACGVRPERFGESLLLSAFCDLSTARRKNLLRSWVLRQGGMTPESMALQEAMAQIGSASVDAQMEVRLGGRVVRRFQRRLYLTPGLESFTGTDTVLQWDGVSALALTRGGVLEPAPGWPLKAYRVSYRRGGERTQPRDRDRSQTLKKILQERALEPWLRDRVPLIYLGGELVAVAGLFCCKAGDATLIEPPGWRFYD